MVFPTSPPIAIIAFAVSLIEILKRRAGETEIRRFLDAWLVDHRDLPPDLRAARGQIGKRITELFLRMDESFSAEQRAHFVDRLATLRDDFISLQVRPRMASVKCADTG